jgi:DNA-binding LacI/PurR family transcriptional regulator
MSSSQAMLEIPRRVSLSSQIASAIRKGIEDGLWEDYLPGERRLCELFQTSRPTVRTALHALAKDGWFEISHGRRSKLRRSRPLGKIADPKRSVGLIIHEPVSHLTATLAQGLNEIRLQLAAQGFTMEVYVCPARGVRAQKRGLEGFIRQHRVFCSVLVSASRTVQSWFSDRGIPALVLGSCHPAVKLPSLEVDYRAVCRHAAGIFLGKGHRNVALVIPDSGTAGDLASEEAFRAVVERSGQTGARATIVRHNGTANGLATRLDALFDSPTPPTGLLVARTQHVFGTMLHLLHRGLKVPDTVSLIARDADHLFESSDYPLSHYSFRRDAYIRLLGRSMLQLINDRPQPRPVLIVPRFLPGRTVRTFAR